MVAVLLFGFAFGIYNIWSENSIGAAGEGDDMSSMVIIMGAGMWATLWIAVAGPSALIYFLCCPGVPRDIASSDAVSEATAECKTYRAKQDLSWMLPAIITVLVVGACIAGALWLYFQHSGTLDRF